MKRCYKCGETKPLDDFSKNRRKKDGLADECRPCKAAINLDWQRRNRDKTLSYSRKWLEQNRETHNERSRQYRKRNPEKKRAQGAVNRAIRAGKIERQPCEVCGAIERIEAHHDDYGKPLDVRWLCRPHHAEHHAKPQP